MNFSVEALKLVKRMKQRTAKLRFEAIQSIVYLYCS